MPINGGSTMNLFRIQLTVPVLMPGSKWFSITIDDRFLPHVVPDCLHRLLLCSFRHFLKNIQVTFLCGLGTPKDRETRDLCKWILNKVITIHLQSMHLSEVWGSLNNILCSKNMHLVKVVNFQFIFAQIQTYEVCCSKKFIRNANL